MRKTKLTVKPTTAFKKDYKLAIKRGLQIELLETVIETLAMGNTLPPENRDHDLTGNWRGHRECHIQPDWLLIYRIADRKGTRTAKLAEKLPFLKNHRYAVQIGGAMGFIVIFGIIVWITKIPAVIYFAVSGAVVGLINGMATTLMYNDN